jgi:alpha-L-rhamnosidase
MLENGATTLWEHWALDTNTYSHNHPMFGSVSEWFYKALAGINPAPDAVGFDKIIISPHLVGDLKWVKAQYNSVRGPITSECSKSAGDFKLRIRIPVGARATVHLPVSKNSRITETDQPLEHANGVRVIRIGEDFAELQAESGEYDFAVTAEFAAP